METVANLMELFIWDINGKSFAVSFHAGRLEQSRKTASGRRYFAAQQPGYLFLRSTPRAAVSVDGWEQLGVDKAHSAQRLYMYTIGGAWNIAGPAAAASATTVAASEATARRPKQKMHMIQNYI